jgi:hypothetical protein
VNASDVLGFLKFAALYLSASAALILLVAGMTYIAQKHAPPVVPKAQRIDANGVPCVVVTHREAVALSCNWSTTAPKWWTDEEKRP